MIKRVNFEDNIYIILARIKLIRDLLVLDTDLDLFLDKTLDDFDFIDGALDTLLTRLLENKKLIKRDEFLNHLMELEVVLSRVLAVFLSRSEEAAGTAYPSIQERLAGLEARSQERKKTEESSGAKNAPEEPLVSPDELNELLMGFSELGRRG